MYYLISAGFDKDKNSIFLRLYNNETQKLNEWFDDSYNAYCLATSPQEFTGLPIKRFTEVKKYDALHDKEITLTKAEFINPAVIKITHNLEGIPFWENHLKIQISYIYDKDIHMGMPYKIINGSLVLLLDSKAEERTDELLKLFEEKKITRDLIKLFEYPVPDFKRASLDIEVLNNEENKMPRPEVANLPIICACLKTSDGQRIAFLVVEEGKELLKYPDVDKLIIKHTEKEMLQELFKFIQQFPFVLTFNGDGFDLLYIRDRALRIGIPVTEIPFEVSGTAMIMRSGIHIDLYRFFSITAIRNYAFQGKYKDVDLNTISKLFLKKEKLNQEKKQIGDMNYYELINYCMRDAELTYDLSSFDGNLVMNLISIISRISRMPIEDASRKAVGRWIASFLFYLHRRLNYLIPNPEDINVMKGKVATKAMIKGKQYQGAIVITPKGGIYFGIKVVDFGSLYPSILKYFNIGYQTIRCNHGEKWNKLSDSVKRFIYGKLYNYYISIEEVNKCRIKELVKLMNNIEREFPDITKTIIPKTEKKLEPIYENITQQKCETLNIEKNIINGVYLQSNDGNYETQKDSENIIMTQKNEEMKDLKINSSNLKVENVNDVEILMNELLKSIISMDEQKMREILEKLSPDMIGKNYNSFAPIVTELLQESECGSNKFAGLPHWICTKHQALESIFIGSLRDLRLGWYKQKSKEKTLTPAEKSWYKVVEQTIKVFMNASYGVFAAAGGFAFHCPSASEEVANIARSIISETVDKAKEMGIEVIYGDTDSLAIREQDPTKIKALQDWAVKKFQIDLELDKEYRFMAFSERKKNYLGVQLNGDIDIKGLTGKKSHTPKYFKKTFEEIKTILKTIQKEEDVPAVKETIRKLVLGSYKKLKQRQWDSLEDLAFHVTINKRLSDYGRKKMDKNGKVIKIIAIPQHIKAVHQLEAAGYVVEAGSTVSFVKTKGGDGVTPLELAKNEDVDIDKYVEFLKATFEQILEPLELDYSEILGYKKLSSFL